MNEKTKTILLKIAAFICCCVFTLATIGGTAYLFYFRKPLFGVVNILLAGMAVPFIITQVKRILE